MLLLGALPQMSILVSRQAPKGWEGTKSFALGPAAPKDGPLSVRAASIMPVELVQM